MDEIERKREKTCVNEQNKKERNGENWPKETMKMERKKERKKVRKSGNYRTERKKERNAVKE